MSKFSYAGLPLAAALLLSVAPAIRAQDSPKVEKSLSDRASAAFVAAAGAFRSEFDCFRDSLESDFASALRENWERFEVLPALNVPIRPEPRELPSVSPCSGDVRINVPSEAEEMLPEFFTAPLTAGEQHSSTAGEKVSFDYYGTSVSVAKGSFGTLRPEGINEACVGDFWEKLSTCDCSEVLRDLRLCRHRAGLNDWALFELVGAYTAAVYPQNVNCAREILSAFLLGKLGLMVRLARSDGRLVCMFASFQNVYARDFIELGPHRYYLADGDRSVSNVFTYGFEPVTSRHPLDLRIFMPPRLGGAVVEKEVHSAVAGECVLPFDSACLKLYDAYPQTDVNVYASAAPERQFAESLCGALRPQLEGRNQIEALNVLLAFLQRDFAYRTDTEQFGREKPFFCEENFVYPYNDCEDRAALFCFLVKELLGLDCLLLDYSDHVNCAVCVTEPVKGQYVLRGDRKFYVCDPACVGAYVGMSSVPSDKSPDRIWKL